MTTEPTPPAGDAPPPGPARRRGPLRAGERVQLTDAKGRQYTVVLTHDGYFQSQRGSFHHRELIGAEDGTVLTTATGHQLLALRPLLSDYVLSMPRGAAVIYPKDAAQVVQMGDIYPGARVVEAGVGSGGLAMSLLSAIGERGHLLSVERRADFAEIAVANVESWFGGPHPAWEVVVGDLAEVLPARAGPATVDRVVLDMLAPWENLAAVAEALVPGGLVLAYVATTTQLSRFVEDLRGTEQFAEPRAWESMVRTWHLEGLAVRPDHRMIGHTGFLVTARRLAPGMTPPQRTRRPAKGAYAPDGDWAPEDVGERTVADKKVRRVRRDVARRAAMEATGLASGSGAPPAADDGG
ncbi:tRNA (adenine-N1)-methyltransferase [Georgenia sp. TF02-10]|uniref:tRNA (adenine-N1)-methyltransferase n=1 Tax=Georgenia sp. TF02-10 TaxID=2917725 RepID=UPI001FA726E9|nr:tRNA (adenine-N1)-methyltransferase [Georgenia sp. TF02-10]UNX56134.1 tRNA (adenine-N1)-methyltransferase [Georgenia sp. TF02-10]